MSMPVAAASVFFTTMLLLACTAALAAAPAQQSGALEELLVTGERPGPAMWRISNGTHDLWIFATLTPLPKHMIWRSSAVASRIAQSQVVLAPPEIVADVSFFGDPAYFRLLKRAEQLPDHQTLDKVLANDLYIRWQNLSDQYLANNYDSHTRPIIDASLLFQQVVEKSGLVTDQAVWHTIKKIASQKNIKIIPVVANVTVDSPEMWIRDFAAVPTDQEVDCLQRTIERVETDAEPMRHRANLWSVGDVEALRALKLPDDRVTCLNALFSVPRFHVELEQAVKRMYDKWLGLADDAMKDNVSSFAVLPMSEMLKADGWLDRLSAKGYLIYAP